MDAVPAIVDADRILPFGFVRGEIFFGQQAAQFVAAVQYPAREFAPVELVRTAFGDRPQRFGQLGHLQLGAGPGRDSAVLALGPLKFHEFHEVFKEAVILMKTISIN